MKVSTMYITPKMAEDFLSRNPKNRRLNPNRVKQYADDMLSGRWYENGESIVITESGELRDGQHRLEAIVKSGKAYLFAVVIVPDESAMIYDSGQNRNASQNLILSAKNVKVSALDSRIHSAIKYILLRKIKTEDLRKYVSPVELAQFADENIDILIQYQECTKALGYNMAHFRIVPVVAAEISALHCGYDMWKLTHFIEVLGKGFCNSENDYPIIALRNYLIKNSKSVGYNSYDEKYSRVIQALHLFEIGSSSKTVTPAKKDWYPWR